MDNRSNFTNTFNDLMEALNSVVRDTAVSPNLRQALGVFQREVISLIQPNLYRIEVSQPPRQIPGTILEPTSRELQKADAETFEVMRDHGWVTPNQDFIKQSDFSEMSLVQDAGRVDSVVLSNEAFYQSPEYRFRNIPAILLFLRRVLPVAFIANDDTILRGWTQNIPAIVTTKLKAEAIALFYILKDAKILKDEMLNFFSKTEKFFSFDAEQNVHLDMVVSDFRVQTLFSKGPTEPDKHIPGVIQLHFIFEKNSEKPELSGFKLQWIKASNSSLRDLILNTVKKEEDSKAIIDLLTQQGLKSNIQTTEIVNLYNLIPKDSNQISTSFEKLDNLLNPLLPHLQYTIRELTAQILQDPFNPVLLAAFYNSLQGESVANHDKLLVGMKNLVLEIQNFYAPSYIKEWLPKVLSEIMLLASEPQNLNHLIALQSYLYKLNQLPGRWHNLGDQLSAILGHPQFEVRLLEFRLADTPKTDIVTFLMKEPVYEQLRINLEQYAVTQDANDIFAGLNQVSPFQQPWLDSFLKSPALQNLDSIEFKAQIDLVISNVIANLIDDKDELHLALAEVLNAHKAHFTQDEKDNSLSYDPATIVRAYIKHMVLTQVPKEIRAAVEKSLFERLDQVSQGTIPLHKVTTVLKSIPNIPSFKKEYKLSERPKLPVGFSLPSKKQAANNLFPPASTEPSQPQTTSAVESKEKSPTLVDKNPSQGLGQKK